MGRELRKVPANWQHPKDERGKYIPMFKEFYGDVLDTWIKQHYQWLDGTHKDLIKKPELKKEIPFFALWDGDAPNIENYQKVKYCDEELTHIQLYETTSEGTPISPVFAKEDFESLCEWAETNATIFAEITITKERWYNILKNDLVYHVEGNLMFI